MERLQPLVGHLESDTIHGYRQGQDRSQTSLVNAGPLVGDHSTKVLAYLSLIPSSTFSVAILCHF